jgi:hypothetical protein
MIAALTEYAPPYSQTYIKVFQFFAHQVMLASAWRKMKPVPSTGTGYVWIKSGFSFVRIQLESSNVIWTHVDDVTFNNSIAAYLLIEAAKRTRPEFAEVFKESYKRSNLSIGLQAVEKLAEISLNHIYHGFEEGFFRDNFHYFNFFILKHGVNVPQLKRLLEQSDESKECGEKALTMLGCVVPAHDSTTVSGNP